MAVNEGTRMDGQFMVISLTPDVCKSPTVPVPYPIVGYLNQSILVSPSVRMRGVPAFHMGSRVATVTGDESGVGGGVVSQVFKGMCRPVMPVPTVRINGQFHNHHQCSLMLMNCAGPEGPANTLGHVKFVGPMYNAPVAPGGKISGGNPPVASESAAEKSCMPGLDSLMPGGGGSGGGLGDIVGMAQKAYGLATTDWGDPAAALGAISGVAGMAGLGGLSKAAGLGSKVAGLATADWSNPGSAMGAVMGVAGPIVGGAMTGGSESSSGGGGGFTPPAGTFPGGGFAAGAPTMDIPSDNQGTPNFPPGIIPDGGF